ncbi:hypothetical protein AV926_11830 [Myroides marinus]|uniref:Uncharacterized protein n=1 Tax=Myroides marinus TaxID=703342 RepID=A0A161S4F6_9FLAO|nr:hypothetical protein [Myroides marinus]KUF38938.1 hypothetical protein AS361_03575 [Myroides marinus]KZE79499.1 hypothetical protein AV926_11830 [Myroides marinus]
MNREIFISVIESIKEQTTRDCVISNGLTQLYGTAVPVYDNSFLLKAIKDIILFHFNNQKEVLSEIDHYCFFCNFGRIEKGDEVLIETPGELYDRLVSEFIVH